MNFLQENQLGILVIICILVMIIFAYLDPESFDISMKQIVDRTFYVVRI